MKILSGDGLDSTALEAQAGGERVREGGRGGDLRAGVDHDGAAQLAHELVGAGGTVEEVAAVGAEDEGSNGGHYEARWWR